MKKHPSTKYRWLPRIALNAMLGRSSCPVCGNSNYVEFEECRTCTYRLLARGAIQGREVSAAEEADVRRRLLG